MGGGGKRTKNKENSSWLGPVLYLYPYGWDRSRYLAEKVSRPPLLAARAAGLDHGPKIVLFPVVQKGLFSSVYTVFHYE